MKRENKIFWGIICIFIAVTMIVGGMGIWEDVSLWKLLLSGVCISVLIDGIRDLGYARILFPIAFLGIIWDEQLGITSITPWPLLWATLFLTIGLSLIFGNLKIKKYKKEFTDKYITNFEGDVVEEDFGEEVVCQAKFGGVTKYVNSNYLRSVKIINEFGGARVYLDNAIAAGKDVVIEVDSKFGGIEIFVPKEWSVDNKIDCSFGAVDINRSNSPKGEVRVLLVGKVSFGAVEVKFV